jgi:hypothetical protein
VLVAFIQRIIGAFDKDFRPLNERCGQESGYGADDHFLKKRGLHCPFNSSEGARIAQCLPFSAWELRIFRTMSDSVQSRPNSPGTDELSRLLELELIQKRATWKQTSQRNRSLRTVAFLFLFLLIVGTVLGFFFVFTRVNGERPNRPASTQHR